MNNRPVIPYQTGAKPPQGTAAAPPEPIASTKPGTEINLQAK
ncbi:MAG TPA: hypothetical protein V6C65_29730 [Allocoleopsis sp.]